MKTLAVIFFVLCIVSGYFEDKTIIDSRILIFLCFAFFLSGMNCLMVIKSNINTTATNWRRFKVIETPEEYEYLLEGMILTEGITIEKRRLYFFDKRPGVSDFMFASQVENSPRYFKEI